MGSLASSGDQKPVVKVKPGKGSRLSTGAPWIYADEIAMDRRTRNLAPGSMVRLVDRERELGCAAFNPQSQIAARFLDRSADAKIDGDWLESQLSRALSLRQSLFDQPYYRLVHAEGDGLPGLVIDRFGEVAVVQPNAAWIDRLLPQLVDALVRVTDVRTVVVNGMSRGRKLEGLEERHEVLVGEISGPVAVPMNGAVYLADLLGGQKTGIFYDQRPNHAFAARLAPGRRVLDVFTHVGGFALASLVAGAESALSLDSSAPALGLATEGAERSGVAGRFQIRCKDAFVALSELAIENAQFDLVICDPPAFAPKKSALSAGLRGYERLARLAAPLVAPGEWLMMCSCSHAVSTEQFHATNVAGLKKVGRDASLVWSGRAGPDHPSHIALPETSYLKALAYRLDG